MTTLQIAPQDTPGLDDVKTISFALSALTVALAGLLWFLPSSLNATLFRALQIVALVLPWVAVWMQARWPALINVAGSKADPRPGLIFVIVAPGVCLLTNQFQNLQIDTFSPLLEFACIPALLLGGALFLASPRDRNPIIKFLGLFLLAGFYGYGVSLQADTALDPSTPRNYSMHVVDKASHRGSRGSTCYYLWLGERDSTADAEQVRVKETFYDSLQIGDAICITAHDGALGVPWQTVQACEAGP